MDRDLARLIGRVPKDTGFFVAMNQAAVKGLGLGGMRNTRRRFVEAFLPKPKGLQIAGVFHNRLARGMRLESDPTTIYGIEDFDGNLRRVHLRDASNPYNTYRIPALPPGPIASPGRDSLEAVVEPEQHDYLYFVSRGDGTHYFSKTYREHTNAVNRYQLRRSG